MEIKDLTVEVKRDTGLVRANIWLTGKYVKGYCNCRDGYVRFTEDEAHIFWEGKTTTDFWRSWPLYEARIKENRTKYFSLITEAQEIKRALKYKLSDLS